MASFPPQQQRRSQARQTSDDSFQQVNRQDSEAPSTTSVDSQTVLLGGEVSSPPAASSEDEQAPTSAPQPEVPLSDNDVRRCWICFSDETDDEKPRTWRTPCPCALTAHESCLLDWVADIERPNGTRTTAEAHEIRCPQCKNLILLSRPQSVVLEYARKLESISRKVLWPATFFGVSYTILLACSHHGVHTIRRIFGDRDSTAILRPRTREEWNWLEQQAAIRFPDLMLPFLREWRGLRVELGLPLIPAALVLARTDYADPVLPLLPIAFLFTHQYSSAGELSGNLWPPSAAATLCVLPYIRQAYNEYMERIWGKQTRAWAEEVRPHFGEEDAAANRNANRGDMQEVIDIRIDVNMDFGEQGEDLGGDENFGEQDEAFGDEVILAPGLNDPPTDHDDDLREQRAALDNGLQDDPLPDGVENLNDIAAELGDMGAQPPPNLAQAVEMAVDQAQERREQRRRRRERAQEPWENFELFKTIAGVLNTSVGALLFPLICSGSGNMIKFLLPKALTTPPASTRTGLPTSLLQTKWGRSILGGCLFVVLKDSIRIYAQWRMAVSFRERRVRDYDKAKGDYV